LEITNVKFTFVPMTKEMTIPNYAAEVGKSRQWVHRCVSNDNIAPLERVISYKSIGGMYILTVAEKKKSKK